jgi:predicted ferric reductase
MTEARPVVDVASGHRFVADVALTAMATIGLALGAWPVLLAVSSPAPLLVLPVVAHVTGMLAGYGVLVLMTLMSRWPVLERGVGSDVLARWHGIGGRIVLSLVLVHAWAAVQAWAQARGTPILVALWQVLGFPWLVSATVATALMVVIAAVSVRIARRRVSYERWHGVHLLAYVAIALSFLHQLAGPDLAGHLAIQVLWALMYAHSFALVARYRVLEPVRAAARHRLRVEAVVQEAPGVVSIVLAGRHLDELRAEPGQFFRWRFLTPDTWLTAHPFSLSAPPTRVRLRLTVKALGDGSRLLQDIEVGTWVVAEGPYGALTAARRSRRDVLLVAGGVGITPMRALFETMPVTEGQDLMLLYRARDREELVFRQELDELAAQRRARVVYLLGSDRGLLSSRSLQRLVPGLVDRDVYLCGPPGFSDAVRRALAEAGLPRQHLHEERFAF